jgi:hypothetical protein
MFAELADGAVDEILARSANFTPNSTDSTWPVEKNVRTSVHRLWTNLRSGGADLWSFL